MHSHVCRAEVFQAGSIGYPPRRVFSRPPSRVLVKMAVCPCHVKEWRVLIRPTTCLEQRGLQHAGPRAVFCAQKNADCPTCPKISQRVHLIQRLCRYYAVSIYRYYGRTGLVAVGVHRTMGGFIGYLRKWCCGG